MEYKMWIIWGTRSSEQYPIMYKYESGEELAAFLDGVEAADGWLEYESFMD
jgi:hypothetical protein